MPAPPRHIDPSAAPSPGPLGQDARDTVRRLRVAPLTELPALHARFGDLARVRLGPFATTYLFHPNHVRHVLVDRASSYDKATPGYAIAEAFTGRGLLTSDGADWARQRRLTTPAFHPRELSGYVPAMIGVARDRALVWSRHADLHEPVDVARDFGLATLEVIGRTVLGADFGGQTGRELRSALEEAMLTAPNQRRLSWSKETASAPAHAEFLQRHAGYAKACNDVDSALLDVVHRRRGEPASTSDLVGRLVTARDETGSGFTDREIVDQVKTLVLAGHETTAAALTYLFHCLAHAPRVIQDIREEIARVVDTTSYGAAHLSRLTLLDAALREALRLFPPIWRVERRAVVDDCIDGHAISAGELVVVTQWVTQRRADLFAEPEKFRPERFLPGAPSFPKHAYFPFGLGPRACVGAAMAALEVKVFAVELLSVSSIAPKEGFELSLDPQVTLRPKGPVPLVVTHV